MIPDLHNLFKLVTQDLRIPYFFIKILLYDCSFRLICYSYTKYSSSVYKEMLKDSQKIYIKQFATESFSFLMRKVLFNLHLYTV